MLENLYYPTDIFIGIFIEFKNGQIQALQSTLLSYKEISYDFSSDSSIQFYIRFLF